VSKAPAESAALVSLGEALFFDKILSGPRTVACASCHHPSASTGDHLPLALGVGATGVGADRRATGPGQIVARSSPSLLHVGARTLDQMFDDARVSQNRQTGVLTTPEPVLNGASPPRPDLAGPLTTALAAQAMFPVTSPVEMRGRPGADPDNELADAPDNVTTWSRLMARLVGTQEGTVGGIEEYRAMFRAAYPNVSTLDGLTFGHAARAIAAYEQKSFSFFDAPLDRYLAGDDAAISEAAKRGGMVFTGPGKCSTCHEGPLLADRVFHGIAAPQLGPGPDADPQDDRGRSLIDGDRRQDYHFHTPTLRNVELTAPYTHAGAYPTLEAVIEHYRDPSSALLGYDPARNLPPEFQGQYRRDPTHDQARLAQIDPLIGSGLPVRAADVADLVAFLQTLTDPRARTPVRVPPSVPSGIPVE
jgi:cytochrome c peroxidase